MTPYKREACRDTYDIARARGKTMYMYMGNNGRFYYIVFERLASQQSQLQMSVTANGKIIAYSQDIKDYLRGVK